MDQAFKEPCYSRKIQMELLNNNAAVFSGELNDAMAAMRICLNGSKFANIRNRFVTHFKFALLVVLVTNSSAHQPSHEKLPQSVLHLQPLAHWSQLAMPKSKVPTYSHCHSYPIIRPQAQVHSHPKKKIEPRHSESVIKLYQALPTS